MIVFPCTSRSFINAGQRRENVLREKFIVLRFFAFTTPTDTFNIVFDSFCTIVVYYTDEF